MIWPETILHEKFDMRKTFFSIIRANFFPRFGPSIGRMASLALLSRNFSLFFHCTRGMLSFLFPCILQNSLSYFIFFVAVVSCQQPWSFLSGSLFSTHIVSDDPVLVSITRFSLFKDRLLSSAPHFIYEWIIIRFGISYIPRYMIKIMDTSLNGHVQLEFLNTA